MRRASPERTPHARSPRPHRACARPACRRQRWDRRGCSCRHPDPRRRQQDPPGLHRAGPRKCVPRRRPRHTRLWHRRTRMHACRRGGVRRASPERTAHARSPRPQSLRVRPPPACRRQSDRRRGGQGAGRRAQGQRDAHQADPRMCVPRRRPPHTPPAAPPHAHARVLEGGRAARQPRAHGARALAAPTPRVRPAPRASGNSIGDEGAKELAAALKANSTLTTLHLFCARRGAALPHTARGTAARACTRAGAVSYTHLTLPTILRV